MPPEKKNALIDYGKILSVLVGAASICGTMVFYAGKLDQKVIDINDRTTRLETYVYPPSYMLQYQQQYRGNKTK